MKFSTRPLVATSLVIISALLAACSGVPKTSGGGSGPGPHRISFTVAGMTGTGLVLQDNASDNLTVNANGTFTFVTAVANNGAYSVTVLTQPSNPAQVCTVANNSGIATAAVTNVQVTCGTANISVAGSVTGLAGSGLVLQQNGGDNLTVTTNGAFTFPTLLVNGSQYNVTILTQPSNPSQACTVTNGSGTLTGNVNNVQINCPVVNQTVGGSIVGLLGNGGGMELQNNGGDNLPVTGNGTFTFPTPLAFGGAYNVSVFIQPGSQPQPCVVFNGASSATTNVTNVIVDCGHDDWTWIRGANTSNALGTNTVPPPVAPAPNLNTPGARNFPATWTDLNGNLWLFSGVGFSWDSTILFQPLYLNEMWEYQGTQNYCAANGCLPGFWTLINKINTPAPRWGAVTWTDAAGDLWLFGGQDSSTGFLNDLWKYNIASNAWTLVGGSTLDNQPGTYGTIGVASAGNIPGGRWAADAHIDSAGNVWLFGGQGFDSASSNGLLNDLWKYNPSTNQWTWVSGSELANPNGVYGTMGTAAAANVPGGRQAASSWIDASGNFLLFGGFGLDSAGTPNGSLNDLWKFDPAAGQWTWLSGSSTANQHGTYGVQGTPDPANVPGSRWRAASWIDASGALWLFGGFGLDSSGSGLLNDLWQYKNGQWTWMKGSNNSSHAGTYGFLSVPSVSSNPGARWGAGYWTVTSANPLNPTQLWLFGGQGFDSTTTSGNGYLNDLWRYLPYP